MLARDRYWNRRAERVATRRAVLRGSALAGVGATSWILAGCGDDDNQGRAATAPASTPASVATTAIRRGGTLTLAAASEPGSLDVHRQSSGTGTTAGFGLAYSRLIQNKPQGTDGVTIAVPELAESWQTPDTTTYIFKLRDDAKFQNISPVSGRAVKADDVVYSFQRQISEKSNASFLPGLAASGIRAIDGSTVELKLAAPNVDFIAALTGAFNRIVPHESVEIKGDLLNGPIIGSGPWIFKSWEKGVAQTLERNPDYWIPGQPYMDVLSFPLLKDPAQMEAQLRADRLDETTVGTVGAGIPLKTAQGLDKTKFALRHTLPYSPMFTMFEQTHPQFKDVRIRRALNMTIDRELVNANVFEGQLKINAPVLDLKQFALPEAEIAKLRPYSPKDAKALWDQAGGAPGQSMPTYDSTAILAIGQIIQSGWKRDLGFNVTIQVIDGPTLTSAIYNPNNSTFSIACAAVSSAPTVTGELEQWYKTGGSRNGGHLSDPVLDDLILKQRQEFDEQKRKELIYEIQRREIEMAYYLTAGQLPMFRVHKTSVQGFPETLLGATPYQFETLWVKA